MSENNRGQVFPKPLSTDLSWDALPELAKDRWEEMIAYSTTVENQLANAKASRTQAEAKRQRIAKKILSATKEACQEIVADGKRTLARINSKAEAAEGKLRESKSRLDDAKTIRSEADSYRDAVLIRAQQQAEELMQGALAAEDAGTKLKQQVAFEAQRLLAQAEAMKAAAGEELEAQRIYTEAARLKAEAHEALEQIKSQFLVPDDPRGTDPQETGTTRENTNGTQEVAQADTPKTGETTATAALEAPEQPSAQVAGAVDGTTATKQINRPDSDVASAESEVKPTSREDREGNPSHRSRAKDRRVREA